MDTFLWEHPDFVSLFPAGNSGYGYVPSLAAPASAKNVIAVGSTLSLSDTAAYRMTTASLQAVLYSPSSAKELSIAANTFQVRLRSQRERQRGMEGEREAKTKRKGLIKNQCVLRL